MHTVAVDDHVEEVERSIRTIKESVRSIIHNLPFQYIPKIMLTKLFGHAVKGWNQLLAYNGVSDSLSPISIILGKKLASYEHLKLPFGTYVQVHADDQSHNDMSLRTIGAIALEATNSDEGCHQFLNLNTKKVITRRQYQVLPMPDNVIKRVEKLALEEKQPPIKNGCPVFERSENGGEYEDGTDDEEQGDEMGDGAEEHVELDDIEPIPDDG